MSWYKINLTHKQVADGILIAISRALEDKVILNGANTVVKTQLAAFSYPADDSEADIAGDCSQIIYMSPMLASLSPEVLLSYDAKECQPPSKDSLEVFVSWDDDDAAWHILK